MIRVSLSLLVASLAAQHGAGAESYPKACMVLEALVGPPSCKLTECRRVGHSKVQLGPDKEGVQRLQAEGDLILLDHSCGQQAPISNLVNEQIAALERKGYALMTGANASAEVVLRKGDHWVEVSGLVLEGSPTVSVRSVEGSRGSMAHNSAVPQAPTEVAVAAAKAPEPTKQAAVEAPVATWGKTTPAPAVEEAKNSALSRTARASGPMPVLPANVSLTGQAARVDLEVVVDERGGLQKVLSAKGAPQLVGIALQSLKDWRFEPALQDGAPTLSALTLSFDFKPRR